MTTEEFHPETPGSARRPADPTPAQIVARGFAEFLAHCQQEGLDARAAESLLNQKLLLRALDAKLAERAAAEAKAAEEPAGLALARVHAMRGDSGGVAGEPTQAYRDACLTWLELAHGVRLGNTVTVSGWKLPRTLVVESFLIRYSDADDPQSGMMWFTGAGVRNCPNGRRVGTHGALLGARVSKE